MNRLRMCLIVCLCLAAAHPAFAGAHARLTTAASSTFGTGWEASKTIDGTYTSNWSSALCTASGGACHEWVAFWFTSTQTTDYFRYVPRTYADSNGTHVMNAPASLNLYYSSGGSWHYITTVTLPSDQDEIPLSGLMVRFSAVSTDGLLVTTSQLRPDLWGSHYFQAAELYAGNTATADTSFSTGSKTCSAYSDSSEIVMKNDTDNLAYDFNVTKLGSDYIAVFHSEAFGQSAGSAGDSAATRTGSSPNGALAFGSRTGSNPGDYIVSSITDPYPGGNPWPHMSGGSAYEPNGIGQGGNPILIQRYENDSNAADDLWTLFYLNVTDQGPLSNWRHYLMVGHPMSVTSMVNTTWASLSNSGTGGVSDDYWEWFTSGSLAADTSWNRRSYKPIPARWHSSYDSSMNPVASLHNPSSYGDSNGLIGNISFGSSLDKMYMFNIDFDGSTAKTYQMETYSGDSVNWWKNRTELFSGWAQKIAYYPTHDRWLVLANCAVSGRNDLCLQLSSSGNVSSLSGMTPANTSYALGLSKWFRDPVVSGVMEQYGILKNNRGQIPGEEFYIYVTERTGKGGAGGLYGMDMHAVKVICQ